MNIYVFSCFVIFFGTFSTSARQIKQYRNDYEYNPKSDAFYKLHIEPKRGITVGDICRAEGATAMVPSSPIDISQAHGMFKKYPDLGPYIWIGSDGKEHESAEEKPTIEYNSLGSNEERFSQDCEVLTRKGKIQTYQCYYSLPFICKVEAKDAPYDDRCGVFGANYTFYQSVGSCYKIPDIVFSWNQAYVECEAENAHLVVVNSVEEHDVVKNLTNTVPSVEGAQTTYFFYAGFRAERPTGNTTRVFKTVFIWQPYVSCSVAVCGLERVEACRGNTACEMQDQTLEEAGYSKWSTNEPNNYLDNEYCGTIFKSDGDFNDVDCTHQYAFICEKEVK